QVSGVETQIADEGATIVSNAAGDLFTFWGDGGNQQLLFAKSTNGGLSFGAPRQVAKTISYGGTTGVFAANGAAWVGLGAAAFHDATHDDVYASWSDLSGEAGCTLWSQAPSFHAPPNTCKSRVWLARSPDGGATWSLPVMIHHPVANDDQFLPVLALDEADG